MSDVVINVENLSKQYRLGEVGTGTLSHDLKRWWYRIRKMEDPYLKIGEVNDRTQKGNSDYVWALKDISFEVNKGEVLGIIGRNGAGKSTLLKILSKTTAPTDGNIKAKGRIASLLEVGTGFHPEMTGRENIFLNGAILGMTRKEIRSKFDEIVDFAGVERYIDTPVKRYSSGMYVRLAFAVAAHLESEILIVDEVLAVGDADFQEKCLGKMGEVSISGKTVLFVSHNMSSIQRLCNKILLLEQGGIKYIGDTSEAIRRYLLKSANSFSDWSHRKGNGKLRLIEFLVVNNEGQEQTEFFMGDDVSFLLKIQFNEEISDVDIGINFKNLFEESITHISNYDLQKKIFGLKGQVIKVLVSARQIYFTPGQYNLDIGIVSLSEQFDFIENIQSLNIIQGNKVLRPGYFPSHVKIFTPSTWTII